MRHVNVNVAMTSFTCDVSFILLFIFKQEGRIKRICLNK